MFNLYNHLKSGQEYVKLWPEQPTLHSYFVEYRAVVVSRFSLKYCPYLALFAFSLPLMLIGSDKLPFAFFYGIFIASIPVQALLMMSKKAKEKLPLALASWYRQGVEKINQQENQPQFSLQNPTFNDLAKLLNFSFQSKNNH